MTLFNKTFCTRCSGLHPCLILDNSAYCEACLDILCNDNETKQQIERIMIRAGIREL